MSKTASATVVISNRLGLHARPATLLAETAGRWDSDITVRRTDQANVVDCKSVLQIMLLAGTPGTELEFTATGGDAADAVVSLVEVVKSKFDEE